MLRANLNYKTGGMSWHQWEETLRLRAARARSPILPQATKHVVWKSMADWIEHNLFAGTNTPRRQYEYWLQNQKRRGMYGAGQPASGQPDHIINAWEKLGDGDGVKAEISAHPENADVIGQKGPAFLRSMRMLGPVGSMNPGAATVGVHTLATMTPYDRSAGGTKPIMHYLRHGWRGNRAMMRPRWPNGVAPFIYSAKPYLPHMSLISRFIITGK